MTWALRSGAAADFAKPFIHELVRSTTHLLPIWIGAGMPLQAIWASKPISSSNSRVPLLSYPRPIPIPSIADGITCTILQSWATYLPVPPGIRRGGTARCQWASEGAPVGQWCDADSGVQVFAQRGAAGEAD